jgi:hypothetical protein
MLMMSNLRLENSPGKTAEGRSHRRVEKIEIRELSGHSTAGYRQQ